jgi:hypothetical protein
MSQLKSDRRTLGGMAAWGNENAPSKQLLEAEACGSASKQVCARQVCSWDPGTANSEGFRSCHQASGASGLGGRHTSDRYSNCDCRFCTDASHEVAGNASEHLGSNRGPNDACALPTTNSSRSAAERSDATCTDPHPGSCACGFNGANGVPSHRLGNLHC